MEGKKLGLWNKRSTILALHQIPTKRFRACSHMAVAHLSCLIVNAAAGCYSRGQTLALNTVTLSLTCFCACFSKEKVNVLNMIDAWPWWKVWRLFTWYVVCVYMCLFLVPGVWWVLAVCVYTVCSLCVQTCVFYLYILSVSVYTVLSVYKFCCWLLGSGGQWDPAVSVFTQVLPLAPQAVSGFPGLLGRGKGCQHRGCISQTGCYRHLVR